MQPIPKTTQGTSSQVEVTNSSLTLENLPPLTPTEEYIYESLMVIEIYTGKEYTELLKHNPNIALHFLETKEDRIKHLIHLNEKSEKQDFIFQIFKSVHISRNENTQFFRNPSENNYLRDYLSTKAVRDLLPSLLPFENLLTLVNGFTEIFYNIAKSTEWIANDINLAKAFLKSEAIVQYILNTTRSETDDISPILQLIQCAYRHEEIYSLICQNSDLFKRMLVIYSEFTAYPFKWKSEPIPPLARKYIDFAAHYCNTFFHAHAISITTPTITSLLEIIDCILQHGYTSLEKAGCQDIYEAAVKILSNPEITPMLTVENCITLLSNAKVAYKFLLQFYPTKIDELIQLRIGYSPPYDSLVEHSLYVFANVLCSTYDKLIEIFNIALACLDKIGKAYCSKIVYHLEKIRKQALFDLERHVEKATSSASSEQQNNPEEATKTLEEMVTKLNLVKREALFGYPIFVVNENLSDKAVLKQIDDLMKTLQAKESELRQLATCVRR